MDNIISNAMQKFKDMIDLEKLIIINGRTHIKSGFNPDLEPVVDPLKTHTLQGVVDLLKSDYVSGLPLAYIHIVSPTTVCVLSEPFGPFMQQHTILVASAYTGDFKFGVKHNPEEFIIALNSQFIENQARKDLLSLTSSITKETAGTVSDTGVSQKMEVRSGVSMRDKVEVKNPFVLKPFRTFSEVDQPESEFVFRVKDEGSVSCVLYEADGSAWKVKAIENIKEFFEKAIPEVTVIA